jgi:thioredoxin reductase
MVCDDGKQRNRASHAIHGLLGHEGKPPEAFLRSARHELGNYKTVAVRKTRVTDVIPEGFEFRFVCEDGTLGVAAKVLLATGIADEVPELPGIESLYGISVHHCLYCDGFEYSGKALAAYGKGDKGVDLAVMMKHWSADVMVCSDGTEPSEHARRKLARHNISIRTEKIETLVGEEGSLRSIKFVSGPDIDRVGMIFATGCNQASDLSERLGCERDKKGGVVTDAVSEETSVPGLYVAGDASRDVLLVAVAIGEGAKAAVAINKSLLLREGFCE